MKADVYIQDHYCGSIDVPGDSILALLAQGMIAAATQKASQLKADLEGIDGVQCSINLRFTKPVTFTPELETEP